MIIDAISIYEAQLGLDQNGDKKNRYKRCYGCSNKKDGDIRDVLNGLFEK